MIYFEYSSIKYIINICISSWISYKHPFLQRIKIKTWNFRDSNILINSNDISSKSIPDFDLKSMRSKKSEIIRDKFTTISNIVINEIGIITLIIIIHLYIPATNNKFKRMRNIINMLTIKLMFLIGILNTEILNTIKFLNIPNF